MSWQHSGHLRQLQFKRLLAITEVSLQMLFHKENLMSKSPWKTTNAIDNLPKYVIMKDSSGFGTSPWLLVNGGKYLDASKGFMLLMLMYYMIHLKKVQEILELHLIIFIS